jgi:hypothetical protein
MRRVALLIGNSIFDPDSGIANLRFPKADVEELAAVLSAYQIGRFDRVEMLIEKSRDEIVTSVARALDEERGAAFLFYYSGHGKVSDSGRLYLAASNTTERHLPANGVSLASIIDMKEDFGCGRFCVILDCCYAGLASDVMKGSKDDQLKSFVQGTGVFFLGAASSTSAAREEEDLGHGVLTAAIIDGLSTGRADINNKGRITGPDLFAWCRDFATTRGAVRPVQVNRVADDELVIAFSTRKLSADIAQRIRSTLTFCWENRLLPTLDIDSLQAYFGQEHVGVPKAESLENDFLEYSQGKIRFDELLGRKAARGIVSGEANSARPFKAPTKAEIPEAHAVTPSPSSQSFWSRLILLDILAALVCALASGWLPVEIILNHPASPNASDPPRIAVLFATAVCVLAGLYAGFCFRRVSLLRKVANPWVTLLAGAILSISTPKGGDASVVFVFFSVIPTALTYLAMLVFGGIEAAVLRLRRLLRRQRRPPALPV